MSTILPASPRQNMLKSQILTGNVLNPQVLDALLSTPRENFVPPALQGVAYLDDKVPLGNGRFLLEPLAFARMLEHAMITKRDTVMDIGCGSGYSTALLSHLAAKVVAVEEISALALQAKQQCAMLTNVTLCESSLVEGAHHYAPYDVILVEGAVEYVPQPLCDQLREGGRMFVFEHNARHHIGTSGLNNLVEYKKIHNILYRTVICDTSVAALAAFKKPATFVF